MSQDKNMISVFGGSQSSPDSLEYQQAYEIGRLLAVSGYIVCTGGYRGVMTAASHGASEAGGHVVGIALSQLPGQLNAYVAEVRPTEDFYQRLQQLIVNSAGFIAVRGGLGTIVEVSLVWNKLTTGVLSPRPLVLVGRDVWEPWLDACQATLAVEAKHRAVVTVVDTAQEAIEVIGESEPIPQLAPPPQ